MADQHRVQEYLRKHKISNLFEDLMAKIINEQPEEPIPFLIRALQRKVDRAGGTSKSASLRRSTGDLRPGSPEMARRGKTASAWATSTDSMAVAKGSKYDKPWLTNSKRVKPHHSADMDDTHKKDWDSRKKVAEATFDDMWESTQKARAGSRQRAASPSRRQQQLSWADADQADEDLLYYSHGYRGPRRCQETDDPLAGELKLARESHSEETQASTSPVSRKTKGKAAEAGQHKRALEQLVLKERKVAQQDSGYEDEHELDPDEAEELAENIEDLKNEGCTTFKKTGVKMSKTTRSRTESVAKPQVKVSICSRCAKVMTGEPSEPAAGTRYGELPSYDYDTEREFERPQSGMSGRSVPWESDEEFESVSQVTGPRRPVWQEEPAGDALTPRKGAHMFSSSTVPSKGRPMYSPEASVASKTVGDSRQEVRRSQPSSIGRTSPQGWDDPRMHTWSPGYSRDDRSDDERREVVTPSVLKQGSMGWQHGYETDASSVDWNRDEVSPPRKGKKKPIAY